MVSLKQSKEMLKRLQKRLIINGTNAQSFYTKFTNISKNVIDIDELNKMSNKEILLELFKNPEHEINFKYSKDLEKKDFEMLLSRINKIYSTNENKKKETGVDNLYIG
jgi:hypothetical protein